EQRHALDQLDLCVLVQTHDAILVAIIGSAWRSSSAGRSPTPEVSSRPEPLKGLDSGGVIADIPVVEAARIPWRPLGRLLVEQGLLSEEELERALEQQAATGRRLGETLVELEFVSHLSLSRALAEQYGIELKSETGFGTGLRAEIERRHDQGRESAGGGPPPQPGARAGARALSRARA